MTRRRLMVIFLPALLLLLLAGAMALLLRTSDGAGWLWSRVTAAVPGLGAAGVRGDLRSGLELLDLRYAGSGATVRIDRAEIQVVVGLLPLEIVIESLRAGRVEVQTSRADRGPAERDAAEVLESLALRVPVRLAALSIRELGVQNPDGGSIAEARDLSLAGRWHRALELHSVTAKLDNGLELEGTGRLALLRPFELQAEIGGEVDINRSSDDLLPSRFSARLTGNLTAAVLDATAEPGGISVSGELANLIATPSWNLTLQAERLAIAGGDAAVEAQQILASSAGSAAGYTVELGGKLVTGGIEPAELSARGSGDLEQIAIEQAGLRHVSGEAAATGTVSWRDGLRVDTRATLERLDPGAWINGWPTDHPLAGEFSIAWAGDSVELPSLRLTIAGTAFELNGAAQLDPAAGRLSGDLRWQDFAWPPASAQPRLSSPSGALTLSGRPEDWTASGTVRVAAAGLPEGSLEFDARGGTEALQMEIARGEILGGSIAGDLDYRWSGAAQWNARIEAESLHTEALLPQYPGVLNARLALEGRSATDEIAIAIESLSGTLRGRPVGAGGRFSFVGAEPRAEGLRLYSGDSEISLDGNPRVGDGIVFRARIASLADVLDEAAGRLEAHGRLRLGMPVPQLELHLAGEELAWRDWRAASIEIAPSGTASSHRVAIAGALIDGYAAERIEIAFDGEQPLERIRADARAGGTAMTAELAGEVADWQHPIESGWRGTIQRLRADHESLGSAELAEPAALSASAAALRLEPACVHGPHGGEVCLRAAWNDGQGLDLAAELDNISLEVLRLFGATDLALSQRMTGNAEWRVPASGDAEGEVRIGISPGEFGLADDEESMLETGPGVLAFDVREGRLEAGRFDVAITGVGAIDAVFSVPDLSRGAASAIVAQVRADFEDIAPLARLVSIPGHVEGRFSADLRVTGTASDPALTGHATLVRGRIEHDATGLVLSDIQLAGAVYDNDVTEMNGTFRAGAGQGRIRATLDFGNLLEPAVSLELDGEDLTLVDVPDVGLVVDPDLNLGWQHETVTIDGAMRIEEARLSPRYLPTAAVTESADLVIVAGAPPPSEPSRLDTSRLKLRGSVAVTLGDDISVELERATAEFGGSVKFTWQDQLVPIGDGTLTMTGEINAYGQLLRIAEGRIRFPRQPADNPHLDIKAERDIFGSRQIKRAGVLVTGTLKRPILEAYTEPMTTEERAMALLVTGNDFDYEQGVGAVEVGTYIAPRLFVSYGIGLFEDQNVISARYDLKKGFGIKATSGQRETGVDISYTIER